MTTWQNAILTALLLAQVPALGDAHFEELEVADGVMLLDWRGEFSSPQRARLRSWLTTVGEAVALLHGQLPRTPIRIELTFYDGSGIAVPFGRIRRSEPQGVEFFVDPSQPLDAFVTNWTAYHELSHLFIPYPGRADVWFSEGLASYYQNILQYRSGLLSEQQAWQKLYDGFERGRNDNDASELTLAQLSPRMREEGAFMRVYWTGALYYLESDLAIREISGGNRTLDAILRDFGACCLERRRRWTGREIAAEFDRLAGAAVFVPRFERFANTTAIPAFLPSLAAAGVEVQGGRAVVAEPGFLGEPEPLVIPDAGGLRNHSGDELSYGSAKWPGNATQYP